jgi:CubicO group peptidase (beta-lactamase class C family)
MDTPAQQRQRAVELGLLHPIRPAGRAPARMALRDRMDHSGTPGVSIAVIRDGVLDWAQGFGVAEAGVPGAITPETRFQAASISKPVAAMTVLRLVEDGRLDLDEDVNEKLTAWHVPEDEHTVVEKVTLRRILTHTAGLGVHGFPGYAPGEPLPTVPQILDGERAANTDAVRVSEVPGTRWSYSGGGYTIAQQLVEDVTGHVFEDVARELVLAPIGMTHTMFHQPLLDELRSIAASGHHLDGSPIAGRYHTYPELAAAGMWTTPSDLAKLVIEVSESHAGRSNRVLSQAMTREMLTPESGSNALGYGVHGDAFGHGGSNEGFLSDLFMAIDGRGGAAIMTNGYGGEHLIPEIRRAIATAYDWPDRRQEEWKTANVDAGIYADYVGDYHDEGDATRIMRVFTRDGALFVDIPEFETCELHPGSEVEYFTAEYGSQVEFHRDGRGAVEALSRSGGPFRPTRWPRVR